MTTNHPGPRLWDALWVHEYPVKVLSVTLYNSQTQGPSLLFGLGGMWTPPRRGCDWFQIGGGGLCLPQSPRQPTQEVGFPLPPHPWWLRICGLHLSGVSHNSSPGWGIQ